MNYSLGLIGYPLTHSLSPVIHNAALKALGLGGEYKLFPVPPLPEGLTALRQLLDSVRQGLIQGLNVTIPHKLMIIHYLDAVSPRSQAIGAVNTIVSSDGNLFGDNTDGLGFLRDLNSLVPGLFASDLRDGQAIILGAGGAARAVLNALLDYHIQVIIAARHPEQAQVLKSYVMKDYPNAAIRIIPLTESAFSGLTLKDTQNIQLIVNATSVGMYPETQACPWPERIIFPQNAVVYDLVYNPLETKLIQLARRNGLRAYNGIGMLVEQAAYSFEIWTGLEAPRSAMFEALQKI